MSQDTKTTTTTKTKTTAKFKTETAKTKILEFIKDKQTKSEILRVLKIWRLNLSITDSQHKTLVTYVNDLFDTCNELTKEALPVHEVKELTALEQLEALLMGQEEVEATTNNVPLCEIDNKTLSEFYLEFCNKHTRADSPFYIKNEATLRYELTKQYNNQKMLLVKHQVTPIDKNDYQRIKLNQSIKDCINKIKELEIELVFNDNPLHILTERVGVATRIGVLPTCHSTEQKRVFEDLRNHAWHIAKFVKFYFSEFQDFGNLLETYHACEMELLQAIVRSKNKEEL